MSRVIFSHILNIYLYKKSLKNNVKVMFLQYITYNQLKFYNISYLHIGQVVLSIIQLWIHSLWKRCLQGKQITCSPFLYSYIHIAHVFFEVLSALINFLFLSKICRPLYVWTGIMSICSYVRPCYFSSSSPSCS